MGKRRHFAVLNLILAGLIAFLAAAPPRAALAADEQIIYDVQDQQRALLEADMLLLCGQRPVLCAETRLFLEAARQAPDLSAADYSYLRGELRDAFAQDRQREEQGHGVWYGPGELAKLTTEQRGLQALERLKAAQPEDAPLVPALAHAIAALSSPAADSLAGVASSWERGNAQQQAADLAWRDPRLAGDFTAQVASAATGLDAGAALGDQVAALTLEPQAGPATPYHDAARAMVVEQLAGPLGYTPGASVGTMLTQSKLSLLDPAFARQYFPGVPTSQSRDAMTRRALDLKEVWAQGEEGYRLWREIEGRYKDLEDRKSVV